MSKNLPAHLSEDRIAAELMPLQRKGGIQLQLPWELALLWISHLQLALRYPGLSSTGSEKVRASVEDLVKYIAERAPLTAELLAYGFDPDYDLDRELPRHS